MSESGAKSWIKDYFPEMYKPGKRKKLFTQKEVVKILDEFYV